MAAQVQITVELLEKLAGIQRKPRQQQQQQQRQQFGRLGLPPELGGLPFGGAPGLHHGHHHPGASAAFAEEQLQRSVAESTRVGELLLKAGDRELAAVQQQADELLAKFRSEIRPPPCGAEQEAVLQCYTQHSQDVLACAELVDAYLACAQHSAGQALG